MVNHDAKVERIRTFVVRQGYHPLDCVDFFVVGEGENETFVVHFAQESPKLPGEEHFDYFDTPSNLVAMLNLRTGKISIPERF